jgi:N-acetyl-anhydromuramyl-L-alanine amidase AmpD
VPAVIIHTTGESDFDRIMRFYQSPDGLQPHYVIDVTGTIRRLAFEDRVAWHAKIEPLEARLYQCGYGDWSCWHWPLGKDAPEHVGQEFSGYRFWRDTWRAAGLQSPIELVTGDHPNGVSVGIELQQPDRSLPDCFTDAQYTALAQLLIDVGQRQGVPLDRQHVLAHQDVSPMRRSTMAGGWDPGMSFRWNRLWDLVRAG